MKARGVPFYPISAAVGTGVDRLLYAVAAVSYKHKKLPTIFNV
jgi:ribosomal protein L27